MKREVFISYKANDPELGNHDGDVANELCRELEAAGITCWIAPRNIEPGTRYASAIMDAIKNCRVMLVVFSRFANASEHIANEVDKAFARKIDIIPFNIDATTPNDEFDYYLGRMQWINTTNDYRAKIPELISALCHKLGKPLVDSSKDVQVSKGQAMSPEEMWAKANELDDQENYEEAFKLYRILAEQGDARAQYMLGICYENGIGVAKDKTKAVRWYRKAAEQGNAEAQYSLGICYDLGIGVAKDKAEAVRWYRKAAEQGLAVAQY